MPNYTDLYNAEDEIIFKQIKQAGLIFEKNLVQENISAEIINKVRKDIAIKYHVVPVFIEKGVLNLVTDSDNSLKNKDQLVKEIGLPIKVYLTSSENIREALTKYYSIEDINDLIINQTGDANIEDDSPLKQKVNDMLQKAARENASDIHILPYSRGVYVWFRIYGHLIDYSNEYQFAASEGQYLLNIIKGMDTSGNADSTISNMPNRGSFVIRRGDTLIDCRISTVPVGSEIGVQKANIREMPQKQEFIQLEKLYSGKELEDIRLILRKSASGLFIISGPVGSGKSTSLYAQINYLWDLAGEPLVVYCIENPIEIKDERFVQVQVREAADEALALTAPKILKTALRSDPDVILYGEIRDAEDAKVAVTGSQTGHLVLSTLHATDCVRTIIRIMDLNISKMSLLSEIKMILSQRLLRVLCPHCSHEHKLTEEEKAILSKDELAILTATGVTLREKGTLEEQKNCPKHCSNGIVGRTAIVEYIMFNDELRDALLQMTTFNEVYFVLKKYGYTTMWEKGIMQVAKGKVELSEIINVIGK